MKIISATKKNKILNYCLLLLLIGALNLNSTSFCQVKTENTLQSTSANSSIVEQDKEKTIAEVKKEFKEQNRDNLNIVRVFSNLLALILIMIVLAWLYSKYGKNILSKAIATKNINKNSINIVSTMPIGQNKYLHIVETSGERFLIGVTNTNISLLKSLNNDNPLIKEKAVSDE